MQAAVLYNLKARHIQAMPYTRLIDIVIAVNPCQQIPKLYQENLLLEYAEKIIWEQHNALGPSIDLPPHIYEVTARC